MKKLLAELLSLKLRQMLLRLLTAWIFVATVYILVAPADFGETAFFTGISLGLMVVMIVFVWLFLCFVRSDSGISLLLVGLAVLYSLIALQQANSFVFAAGCCIITAALVFFSDSDKVSLKVKPALMWTAAALLVVGFTALVGSICCMYYDDYRTPCYDFGIFAQMYYYMKETGAPLTTCERDGLLSHFAVHFSPIYYLLLPVYFIFPSPKTLLVAQCFITVSGVIPLILICKRLKLSDGATLLFSLCYTLYPCFAGSCFWYFHENNFLPPLILWVLYFAERKKLLPTLGFSLLLLGVKEDAAVYLAVIALFMLLSRKNYKSDLPLLGLSLVYFVVVTMLMKKYGDGVMTNRYENYMYDGGDSLITVIFALVKNPVYAVEQCFTEDKFKFLFQMLLPLGFLPLCIKKPQRLILLIPLALFNLMSPYVYQYDISYQYCFGSGTFLIYMAALNYAEMGENRKKLLITAACCSVIVFMGLYSPKLFYAKTYYSSTSVRQAIDVVHEIVPDDASVAASELLLPPFSQRREIYKLENTTHQAEYYILDMRLEENVDRKANFDDGDYESLYSVSGVVEVYRNLNYAG